MASTDIAASSSTHISEREVPFWEKATGWVIQGIKAYKGGGTTNCQCEPKITCASNDWITAIASVSLVVLAVLLTALITYLVVDKKLAEANRNQANAEDRLRRLNLVLEANEKVTTEEKKKNRKSIRTLKVKVEKQEKEAMDKNILLQDQTRRLQEQQQEIEGLQKKLKDNEAITVVQSAVNFFGQKCGGCGGPLKIGTGLKKAVITECDHKHLCSKCCTLQTPFKKQIWCKHCKKNVLVCLFICLTKEDPEE